jgi:hypothetical protein
VFLAVATGRGPASDLMVSGDVALGDVLVAHLNIAP